MAVWLVLIITFVDRGLSGVISFILATFITFLFLLGYSIREEQAQKKRYISRRREGIPSEVRRKVWHRDGGACQRCGSTEGLEFDHIVPVSRGGSNTEKNIELLCKTCNRQKSARIE